ncbi:MAG TPA: hypothetical protein VIU14_02760 [Mesorhizobium sp.]|jgi:hypothetical protein
MSFPGFFNSHDLAMLTAVLDEFCHENGYGPGRERDAAAGRIMDLFTNGAATSAELLSVLRRRELIPRRA